MPHLPHISTSLFVESRKLPTPSPGPEVKKPLRLYIQNQSHNSVQKALLEMNLTKQEKGRVNSPTRINTDSTNPAERTTPANSGKIFSDVQLAQEGLLNIFCVIVYNV